MDESGSAEPHRWSLLLDAVVGLARAERVDDLLARLVAAAAELVDAGYAALSLADGAPTDGAPTDGAPAGSGVAASLTHGTPPGRPLAELPEGTWMQVPVRVRDQVFGHLRLVAREHDGTRFGVDDEEIVLALAAASGVAIENARLHASAARRERWLAASAEITARLVEQTSELDALQLVADRARELAGARIAWVISGPDPDSLELRVVSGADVDVEFMRTLPLDGSVADGVIESGVPLRLDDFAGDARIRRHGPIPGWPVLGPAIVVPLEAVGVRGTLGLGWVPADRDRFARLQSSLPAEFAQHASLALRVSQGHQDQRQLAVLRDRDRIGRDLHDVVIQRLFAVGLGLEAIGRLPAEQAAPRLDDAIDQIDETIRDLRTAIHQLRRAGATRDVHEQVCDVVAWSEPVLGFRPYLRFAGPVRTGVPDAVVPDLLAVLTEAISNAGRHAGAGALRVELSVDDEHVLLAVRDDGRGITDTSRESGLANMRHRALRHDGDLLITSEPGHGTELRWQVPRTP